MNQSFPGFPGLGRYHLPKRLPQQRTFIGPGDLHRDRRCAALRGAIGCGHHQSQLLTAGDDGPRDFS